MKIVLGAIVALLLVLGGGYWFFTSSSGGAESSKTTDSFSTSTPQNFGEPQQVQTGGGQQDPQATTQATTNTNQPNKKYMQAILHTNQGDITIEFLDAQAPNTVANFVKLAQAGFYDGTKFHRVIKSFMIQGGDPLSKDDAQMARWGTGGPGYQFADEISATNQNNVGTIAMANSGPNTNGSQFFINVAPNNFLDTKHTVFGKITAGMDVVTKIENTPTGAGDRPTSPMVINSITLK